MHENHLRENTLTLSGFLFLLIAGVHLYRIFFPFPVVVGPYDIPMWASVVAFLITGALGGLLFGLNKEH